MGQRRARRRREPRWSRRAAPARPTAAAGRWPRTRPRRSALVSTRRPTSGICRLRLWPAASVVQTPVALARLEPGEDVLDLGSGGGIDVLLSARRVGPEGRAYGVDMTAEMLKLARANQAKARVTNAEFLEGRIEAIPLPDLSVDVVVSNCVINLSADKDAVFAEAHRVLRPGGRLALADVVADQEPDAELVANHEAWAACLAGAVTRDRYRAQLESAGFTAVEITDSHPVVDGFCSVFVRAAKPAES